MFTIVALKTALAAFAAAASASSLFFLASMHCCVAFSAGAPSPGICPRKIFSAIGSLAVSPCEGGRFLGEIKRFRFQIKIKLSL